MICLIQHHANWTHTEWIKRELLFWRNWDVSNRMHMEIITISRFASVLCKSFRNILNSWTMNHHLHPGDKIRSFILFIELTYELHAVRLTDCIPSIVSITEWQLLAGLICLPTAIIKCISTHTATQIRWATKNEDKFLFIHNTVLKASARICVYIEMRREIISAATEMISTKIEGDSLRDEWFHWGSFRWWWRRRRKNTFCVVVQLNMCRLTNAQPLHGYMSPGWRPTPTCYWYTYVVCNKMTWKHADVFILFQLEQ